MPHTPTNYIIASKRQWKKTAFQKFCHKLYHACLKLVFSLLKPYMLPSMSRCDAKPTNLDSPGSHCCSHQKTDFLIKTFDSGILWDDYYPVLQIFRSKLHRALRSEPFFSILLPMERPGLWLWEDAVFVFNWGVQVRCRCKRRKSPSFANFITFVSHKCAAVVHLFASFGDWMCTWWGDEFLLNACRSLKCMLQLVMLDCQDALLIK